MPVRNMVYDGLDYAEQVRKVQKEHKGKYTISEELLSGFNKERQNIPCHYTRILLRYEKMGCGKRSV